MKIAKGYTKLQMWVYDTPVLQILVSHGYCVAIFTVVAGHYCSNICSNIPFVRRNKRKGSRKDCSKESLRAKSSSVSHTGCCRRDCCFPVFTQTKLPLKPLRCSVGLWCVSGLRLDAHPPLPLWVRGKLYMYYTVRLWPWSVRPQCSVADLGILALENVFAVGVYHF